MRHTSMSLRAAAACVVVVVVAVGCPTPTPDKPEPPAPVVFGTTEGLLACDDATIAAHPDSRCFTWRAVAGVSMGGGTSGRVGFRHPELWDVVGVMGTPFGDNEFFFRMLRENHMAGFCDLEHLEQLVADGVDLDDKNNPDVFCGVHDVFPLIDNEQASPGLYPAVAGSDCAMFRSDFNHWYRGPDAGRGGSFSRNGLIEVMHDLVAAFGNPFYENPLSAYFPPGVAEDWYVHPNAQDEAAVKAALCATPQVLEGVYNREFNPDGSSPVVTFCDGNTRNGDALDSGDYDPDDRSRPTPIEFLIAVDLNGNGRRDYGEPVIINNEERFRDCGSDGACDGEAGDTDDNWEPLTNPTGTEGNGRLDEGETFDDDGIDGVPGTNDHGEGNGIFDRSPTLEGLVNDSPAALYARMDAKQAARLDVWMDAGVRDFLNSSQISNSLYSQLAAKAPSAADYNGFRELPVDPKYTGPTDTFQYFMPDYSRDAMGQVAYLRYGDAAVCPSSDARSGDGNHVGTGDVASRIFTLFSFLSERMPAQGRDVAFGGSIAGLGPTGQLSDFAFLTQYDSPLMQRSIEYGVLLPPDYYFPENVDTRYPVLYFFHGQGMEASNLVALGLALLGPMKESVRNDRINEDITDLQRAIIIWVDGNCDGDACYTGNFYTDFKGLPCEDRRFEAAFYELVQHVEGTFRIKSPELIALDQIED